MIFFPYIVSKDYSYGKAYMEHVLYAILMRFPFKEAIFEDSIVVNVRVSKTGMFAAAIDKLEIDKSELGNRQVRIRKSTSRKSTSRKSTSQKSRKSTMQWPEKVNF
jgi:hypothetical protein